MLSVMTSLKSVYVVKYCYAVHKIKQLEIN